MTEEKVTVPKFIASIIQNRKNKNIELFSDEFKVFDSRFYDWIDENNNGEDFCKAWYEGYEVIEEEPKFYLRFRDNWEESSYLNLDIRNNHLSLNNKKESEVIQTKFTKLELSDLGNGAYYKTYVNDSYEYTLNDLKKIGYTYAKDKGNLWEWVNPAFELIEVEKEK